MENKEKKTSINSQYCFKVNAPETYWKTKCKKPKHPAASSLFSTLRWNLRTSVLELLILKLIQHKSNTASLQMGLHPKSFWHYTTQFLLLNCDQTEGKIIWDENIIRQPQSEGVTLTGGTASLRMSLSCTRSSWCIVVTSPCLKEEPKRPALPAICRAWDVVMESISFSPFSLTVGLTMELKIILLIHLKHLNKNKGKSLSANYFQYKELKLLHLYKLFSPL